MTITDKIIYFTVLLLFWRGWSKGFAQTILGPLSLLIGSALSYIYYAISRNLIVSVAIGIICPIILNMIFSMTLGVIFLGDGKKRISIPSRFCGALINIIWGEIIILSGMILIVLIPIPILENTQRDIKDSWVYAQSVDVLNKNFNINLTDWLETTTISTLTDPNLINKIEKTKEFKEVLEDPAVQELLNDPQAAHAIETKNIGSLLQNPKFINLTKNPDLLKKFLALYSTILDKNTAQTTADTPLSKQKPNRPIVSNSP